MSKATGTAPFSHFECRDPRFAALVAGICVQGGRRGVTTEDRRIRLNAVSIILAALAYGGPQGLPVPIPRGNRSPRDERYPVGHKSALMVLLQGGWLVESIEATTSKTQRPEDDPRNGSVPSAYSLSALAWDELGEGLIPLHAFRWVPRNIVCCFEKVGKAKLRKPVKIDESAKAQMSAVLVAYHNLLKRFEFALAGEPLGGEVFELSRIFTNNANLGGRFYSAFCGFTPRHRSALTIDGQSVCERDFSAFHLRIGLALVGELVVSDPRNLGEQFKQDHVKRFWNAAVNTKSLWSESVAKEISAEGGDPRALKVALLAKHPKLGTLVGQEEIGLRLQRADSELVEALLKAFTAKLRPLLPVHDGFYFLEADLPLFNHVIEDAKLALWRKLREWWPNLIMAELPLK